MFTSARGLISSSWKLCWKGRSLLLQLISIKTLMIPTVLILR